MQISRVVSLAALFAGLVLSASRAQADPILFNLDANTGFSSQSLIGFGNGVIVSTTTSLTGIAFDLDSQAGANVKYVIFDASNSLLYTSSSFAVPTSTSHTWYEQAVSYTLQAGSTYYIGYVQDAKVSGEESDGGVNTNGLKSEDNYDRAYTYYSVPRYAGSTGIHNFAMQLSGSQMTATPEPASLLLLGTGLVAGGLMMRRRLLA